MSNKDSISYRQVGDYNIPNLTLPPEEANIRLGKWGMLHKDYLEKHNRVFFNLLLTQGKLYQHCAEIENQAQQMFDTLIEQMKEANQFEWVQKMNSIQAQAREIVYNELIYT